jgi:hypothetical protein
MQINNAFKNNKLMQTHTIKHIGFTLDSQIGKLASNNNLLGSRKSHEIDDYK